MPSVNPNAPYRRPAGRRRGAGGTDAVLPRAAGGARRDAPRAPLGLSQYEHEERVDRRRSRSPELPAPRARRLRSLRALCCVRGDAMPCVNSRGNSNSEPFELAAATGLLARQRQIQRDVVAALLESALLTRCTRRDSELTAAPLPRRRCRNSSRRTAAAGARRRLSPGCRRGPWCHQLQQKRSIEASSRSRARISRSSAFERHVAHAQGWIGAVPDLGRNSIGAHPALEALLVLGPEEELEQRRRKLDGVRSRSW